MTSFAPFIEPPDADLQPVDWQTIDDAIYDWLNEILDMGDRIVWENLNEPQPAEYPYLSVLRSPMVSEGGIKEQRNRTLDAAGDVIPPGGLATPAANEEIVVEPVAFTVAITALVGLDEGGRDPNCDAMRILNKAKASIGLTSTKDRFNVAAIAVVDDLDVLDTSVVVNAEWVKKATLDVIFRTASVISEQTSFIDKVNVTSTDLGVDTTIDAS